MAIPGQSKVHHVNALATHSVPLLSAAMALTRSCAAPSVLHVQSRWFPRARRDLLTLMYVDLLLITGHPEVGLCARTCVYMCVIVCMCSFMCVCVCLHCSCVCVFVSGCTHSRVCLRVTAGIAVHVLCMYKGDVCACLRCVSGARHCVSGAHHCVSGARQCVNCVCGGVYVHAHACARLASVSVFGSTGQERVSDKMYNIARQSRPQAGICMCARAAKAHLRTHTHTHTHDLAAATKDSAWDWTALAPFVLWMCSLCRMAWDSADLLRALAVHCAGCLCAGEGAPGPLACQLQGVVQVLMRCCCTG